MTSFLDLSRIGTGAVVAPAGHGKTYAIGQTITAHPELRILVLTHTHAGIAALKRQTGRKSIRQLRLETIASFALKIARSFPGRGGFKATTAMDFDQIYMWAATALQSSTILKVIAGAFDLIIVDEYQDTNVPQAAIIDMLATQVSTVVVGDPLQGIYDFGTSPAIQWNGESSVFPLVETLSTPHRWVHTNPALGRWLSDIRTDLEADQMPKVDHNVVEVVRLERPAAEGGLNPYIQPGVPTAIITADSVRTGTILRVARAYQGRVRVAEAAEFSELRALARNLESLPRPEYLAGLIDFAALARTRVCTGPVKTLRDKLRSHGVPQRSTHPCVVAAQSYLSVGSQTSAAHFFRLVLNHGVYTHRPELPKLLLRAFSLQDAHPDLTLDESVGAILEQRNHAVVGEQSGAVVGSTLRLKGLEFETVVVLDANDITSRKHLYVALSRATRRLIVTTSS